MDKYRLQKSVEINGVECEFNTDFRDILEIFEILNDPDLLESEAITIALQYFYKTEDYEANLEEAVYTMFEFITGESAKEASSSSDSNSPQLFDWNKDFKLIIAPVNKILGFDARGAEYLHWWTFLSAFMEIGECTFSTYVGIRDKLNKHKKLDKHEQRIYNEHKNEILLPKKYDSTTQAMIDEIMGV